jgi:hypothetical protein
MARVEDAKRLFADRLVAIFTAAHGRPPADLDELDSFIEMQVRARARAGRIHPRGSALCQ